MSGSGRAAAAPTIGWAMGLEVKQLQNRPGMGLVHPLAGAALDRLISRAQQAGFQLAVASGHRSYQRQLAIFNDKFSGQRPVTSDRGQPLSRDAYDDSTWLHAVLRYSALPGTSRHHWGTDFDIWDPGSVGGDYRLALEVQEYTGDGPFAALSDWLSQLISQDDAEGFYRPYTGKVGGVAAEPWHLSHRPTAQPFYPLVTDTALWALWSAEADPHAGIDQREPLTALECVGAELNEVLQRYVRAYYD